MLCRGLYRMNAAFVTSLTTLIRVSDPSCRLMRKLRIAWSVYWGVAPLPAGVGSVERVDRGRSAVSRNISQYKTRAHDRGAR